MYSLSLKTLSSVLKVFNLYIIEKFINIVHVMLRKESYYFSIHHMENRITLILNPGICELILNISLIITLIQSY